MDKKYFVSAKELCQIIKMCSNSNIKSLEFGDIKMEFGLINQLVPQPLDEIQTRSFEQKSQQIVEEVESEANKLAKEHEDEALKLLDPLAWERLQFEGEDGRGEGP